jgi:hypothetical protein
MKTRYTQVHQTLMNSLEISMTSEPKNSTTITIMATNNVELVVFVSCLSSCAASHILACNSLQRIVLNKQQATHTNIDYLRELCPVPAEDVLLWQQTMY